MGRVADRFGKLPYGDRVRLALGELVDEDGLIPAWCARDAFLMALNSQVPTFYRDLALRKSMWRAFADWEIWKQSTPDESYDALAPESPELRCLVEEVNEALRPVGLTATWMRHVVFAAMYQLLASVRQGTLIGDDGRLNSPHGVPFPLPEMELESLVSAPIKYPRLLFGGKPVGPDPDETYWPLYVFEGDEEFDFAYNPWVDDRTENEAAAVAWFRARYRAAQDAREKEAGGRKPSRTKGRRFEHFEWAVRYQVLRHTFADIARDANRSRQSVSEAVYDVLDLVDLEPRQPDRRGRK